jgi:ElaB/YqjD/DUF883 family membrane-anchored ribosome-binding protein
MFMTPSSQAQGTSTADRSQHVGESVQELGTAAADLGEEARAQVTSLTQQVRQQATNQLNAQKERVVDTLETASLLLHQAGEHAQQQDNALLATYVEKAAQHVGTFTESLAQQDVTQIVQTTKDFARREPMLFVGGALAVGFLGARFLRSSSQQAQQPSQDQAPNDGPSAAVSDVTPELPAYDIDQTSTASSASILGTTYPAPSGTDTPEATGFVEDYESAVQENDPLEDALDSSALPDLEDIERSENL